MKKLETFHILDVLDNDVSKMANEVVVVEKMAIKVGWIDKVLREIGTKRDHFTLLWEACLLTD